MPRGRCANHKGRSRQFTPAEQLQQDLEEGLRKARSQINEGENRSSSENEQSPKTKMNQKFFYNQMKTMRPAGGGGVQCLIEISNPNRPANPNALRRTALRKLNEVPDRLFDDQLPEMWDRGSDRARGRSQQKASQVKADLARLALIRQEREAAAEKRLNAKREMQAAAQLANLSNISLKKKSINTEQNASNDNGENERPKCIQIDINLGKNSFNNNSKSPHHRRRHNKIQNLHISDMNIADTKVSIYTPKSKDSNKGGRKNK